MKIGYFSNTNINVSETFVYDLSKNLYRRDENVIFFSGEKSKITLDFNVKALSIGFNHENMVLTLINKLSLKFHRVRAYYTALKESSVHKKLYTSDAKYIDMAYVQVFFAMDTVMDTKHYENIKNLPITFHLYTTGKHSLIKEVKEKGVLNDLLNNS